MRQHEFPGMNAEGPGVRQTVKAATGYGLMIAAAVAAFLCIRSWGERLAVHAPFAPVVGKRVEADRGADVLLHLLLALVVIIVAARAVGFVFQYLRQPPVIGEVVAGILLGPSFLGHIAPGVSGYLLPPAMGPFLNMIAQVGVLLYMFLVGLELDTSALRRSPHIVLAISHASILLPFLLGAVVALGIYPLLSSGEVPFTVFALFMGVSMSVTAFPVLARILTDRRLHTSRLGVMALSCAAIDDVTAWCLLEFVVSVAHARSESVLPTVGFTALYIACTFVVFRPLMGAFARRYEGSDRLPQSAMSVVFVALLLSALITEFIGIHAIFGAFLLGAVVPHDSRIARDLSGRLEDLVVVLLLPAFFAFTGLRTEISLVHGAQQWLLCAGLILVASAGKFGGSAVAARLAGLSWLDASALGVLMNTRGLVELIVLNIGLDLRVISPTVYAMLVIMALVTTVATTPILALIARVIARTVAAVEAASCGRG